MVLENGGKLAEIWVDTRGSEVQTFDWLYLRILYRGTSKCIYSLSFFTFSFVL